MAITLCRRTRLYAWYGRRARWDHHLDAVAVQRDRLVGGRAVIRAIGRHLDNRIVNLIEQRADLGRIVSILIRQCLRHNHAVRGVVQNSPFLGYTGERKPPAFEAKFRLRSWPVREAVSLPRSSALRLNGSEAHQRQPMRMALAGHQ